MIQLFAAKLLTNIHLWQPEKADKEEMIMDSQKKAVNYDPGVEKPLVSAVITTHNRIDMLRRAIGSVLSQDYENLELVVVDDASSDDTQEYMEALSKKDKRVNYVRISPEDTKGANYARNTGIKVANGDFVAFLDDDDEWLPRKVSEQVAFFRRHPDHGAVSADWINVYCFEKKTYQFRKRYTFNRGKNEYFITPYLGITSGLMVKKSVLEKVGGFDEKLPRIHEVELEYRICMNYKAGHISKPLFRYYHYFNKKSISSNVDSYIKAFEMIKEKYSDEISQFTEQQKKRFYAVAIKETAYRYLISGDKKMYRKTISPHLGLYGITERAVYYCSYFCDYDTFIRVKAFLKNMLGK